MEDGQHWELQRLYQDFYDLQINLIQEHPREAGNVKGVERSLPYMPGPVTYVTDNISNGRRANLDEYIRNLLKLGPHITRGGLVRAFFQPREGDYEIDPSQPQDYRLSGGSQGSQQNSANATSPQSSADALNTRQQPSQLGHYRTNSQATTMTMGQRGPNGAATAMKIKVWFEPDNCVVIRMPPPGQFSFAELYKKLKERRALEGLPDGNGGGNGGVGGGQGGSGDVELEVAFRDENMGHLVPIRNDQELQSCLDRGERFTLSVRVR
jgi:bud emergence protein 1